jgi:uncharacterized protein
MAGAFVVFIEIEDLNQDPLHVHHVFPVGEILFSHMDAALNGPVTADFVLNHKGSDLQITGTLSTVMKLRCSRCAKETVRDLSAGFDLSYLPQPDWPAQDIEVEIKYEDMDVAFYDGIRFDVNLMVLEQIELSMPMKFVCKEDCKGLCFKCGTDLNEGACSCSREVLDARMGALLEFRKKMDA